MLCETETNVLEPRQRDHHPDCGHWQNSKRLLQPRGQLGMQDYVRVELLGQSSIYVTLTLLSSQSQTTPDGAFSANPVFCFHVFMFPWRFSAIYSSFSALLCEGTTGTESHAQSSAWYVYSSIDCALFCRRSCKRILRT